MRRRTTSLLLALLLAAPASAQQPAREPTSYDRAIAAGYKALTLCSAMFNGTGRTQAQIEALELTGIYPEYDAIVPTLRAEVHSFMTRPGDRRQSPQRHAAVVEVPFDQSAPPRRATWQVDRGCTLEPIGQYREESPGMVTVLDMPPAFAGSRDDRPWPAGDRMRSVRTSRFLAAVEGKAFDGASYGAGRTTATIIVHDGRIVAERYAAGFGIHTAQRTWSVAKSIAGTLIGMAVGDRTLGVGHSDRVRIPEWRDSRGNIRLDDLLRMASGLYSATAGNRTDAVYFGGTSVTDEIAYWPRIAESGTRFRYANNDILAAVRVLRAALNNDDAYAAFPRSRLFAPLSMTRTVAETDHQGNFILSSQVWSTARDLARLGQFWLQDGVWEGRRLLPEGWMAYMTRASGPQPASGPGYGATLWLFGPGQGLPAGSYAAQGNRGQYVMVVPSRRLVIVRRGEDAAGTRFDIARFTADVIAALPAEGARR
ncbi:MAG TPA: serine hydrolase [Allosphingosinicella sp.]|nr:serine hydrolase [Allosphingosinicella sp.]